MARGPEGERRPADVIARRRSRSSASRAAVLFQPKLIIA
jgi:hypothetical protein